MYVAKLVVDQAGLFPKVCSGDANNIYLQFCLCPLQKVLRSSHADYPADICQLSHYCQTKAGLSCGSVYFAFGTSGQRSSRSAFGQIAGNGVNGQYKRIIIFFLFFFFFFSLCHLLFSERECSDQKTYLAKVA